MTSLSRRPPPPSSITAGTGSVPYFSTGVQPRAASRCSWDRTDAVQENSRSSNQQYLDGGKIYQNYHLTEICQSVINNK